MFDWIVDVSLNQCRFMSRIRPYKGSVLILCWFQPSFTWFTIVKSMNLPTPESPVHRPAHRENMTTSTRLRRHQRGQTHLFRTAKHQFLSIFALASCSTIAHSFIHLPTTVVPQNLNLPQRWYQECSKIAYRPSHNSRKRPPPARNGGLCSAQQGLMPDANEAVEAKGDRCRKLIVVGGGAAGYFGAIQAAARARQSGGKRKLEVVVLEAGRLPLQKVKISGGGRCNVMHDARKSVSLISQGYPRGNKQLIGPFKSLFGPTDAAEWFRARGVTLKTEGDGRMFPTTDSSQTIIDCLEAAARDAGVQIVTSAKVTSVVRNLDGIMHNGGDNDGPGDINTNTNSVDAENEQTQSSTLSTTSTQSSFELAFTAATPLSPSWRKALLPYEPSEPNGEVESSGRATYRVACDYVLQATGASREGHAWADSLGHAVSSPVPSLFTLTINDSRLAGLAGLSVQDAEVKLVTEQLESSEKKSGKGSGDGGVTGETSVRGLANGGSGKEVAGVNESGTSKRKGKKKGQKSRAIVQRGPLLITHTGVSGPAALKLSAFGARDLSEGGYRGKLVVNWLAGNNLSKAFENLQKYRAQNPKKTVFAFCPISGTGDGMAAGRSNRGEYAGVPEAATSPLTMPRRLWQSLAIAAGLAEGDRWADVSKAKLSALARELTACELQVVGKGSFKEEFVTCGGVALSAVDMRTMESRTVPGLFFAGEVVDIDGVTGGYNFQSAWTTGWVAGNAIGTSASAAASEATAVAEHRLSGQGRTSLREDGYSETTTDERDRRRKGCGEPADTPVQVSAALVE